MSDEIKSIERLIRKRADVRKELVTLEEDAKSISFRISQFTDKHRESGEYAKARDKLRHLSDSIVRNRREIIEVEAEIDKIKLNLDYSFDD